MFQPGISGTPEDRPVAPTVINKDALPAEKSINHSTTIKYTIQSRHSPHSSSPCFHLVLPCNGHCYFPRLRHAPPPFRGSQLLLPQQRVAVRPAVGMGGGAADVAGGCVGTMTPPPNTASPS